MGSSILGCIDKTPTLHCAHIRVLKIRPWYRPGLWSARVDKYGKQRGSGCRNNVGGRKGDALQVTHSGLGQIHCAFCSKRLTQNNTNNNYNNKYWEKLIVYFPFRVGVTLRLAVYLQSVRLGAKPLEAQDQQFFFQLNTCGHSPYATASLMRGWICRLQLLMALARAVILSSESRGTNGHSLLSQIRDSPNLDGQVPVFLSPKRRVALLIPPGMGFHFLRLLRLAGLRCRYSTPPPHVYFPFTT
jgi:hypothetical protein